MEELNTFKDAYEIHGEAEADEDTRLLDLGDSLVLEQFVEEDGQVIAIHLSLTMARNLAARIERLLAN